ncbi:Vacuolar protein-sorting-associated protein 27 [Coniosporium tulheliwenetii]|uniref:Vacuolar protein-sorting-associated protein 27 n=1 Tax=Coniosporium tulheliwenetii TaxID=3383036 RepID=A0ACC2YYL1_9PEZI|nr:Vacuolar protein-sorting-associated protein 27 [Cladosporium sp. JES 115]
MAGWFASTNSALDEQVDRATASSLEDIALNLEISDIIRSKTVQPKEAMRSLKRRIGHKNPNIQLAALNLTDTCVKNGGSHFMAEIASREFMDNLVSLVKVYGGNEDVRNKILELIQNWAAGAEGRSNLMYINEVYRTLLREGFRFPPKQDVASSMFDSSAVSRPLDLGMYEWRQLTLDLLTAARVDRFGRVPTLSNAVHLHQPKASLQKLRRRLLRFMLEQKYSIAALGDLGANKTRATPVPKGFDAAKPARTLYQGYQGSMEPRSARVEDSFDADLKRALEMSLEEAKGHSGGYVPQSQLQSQTKPPAPVANGSSKPSKAKQEEDDDPELKAAIAASLADMEEQKKKHAAALKQQSSSSNGAPLAVPRRNDYELTPVEAENINLFSTLVDRLQHQPPGTILREPQIQELYESIDTLLDLHAKLSTVVRYYDRMLEERLSSTYSQQAAAYGYPSMQRPASSLYPSIPSGAPDGNAGAESYYTGNAAPSDPYAHPQATYGGYAQQPQSPYMRHDKQPAAYGARAPIQQYQQQGYPAQAPYPNTPAPHQLQRQPSAPYPSAPSVDGSPQLQRRTSSSQYPSQLPPQYAPSQTPSQYAPSQPLIPDDPNAGYYYGQQPEPQPSAPQTQQPLQQQAGSQPAEAQAPQAPQAYPSQPPQQQPSQPSPELYQRLPQQQQHQPPPQSQQQQQQQQAPPYWQQQQQPQPQQQWPQAPSTQAGYGQEAFPVAPQHQPQAPKVEEALIEL